MKRTFRWIEQTAEIVDVVDGEELEIVAKVISDSAADPGDGDGPILGASRDLLYAAEALVGAFGGDYPDWLQGEIDGVLRAIEKARQP